MQTKAPRVPVSSLRQYTIHTGEVVVIFKNKKRTKQPYAEQLRKYALLIKGQDVLDYQGAYKINQNSISKISKTVTQHWKAIVFLLFSD